MPTKAKDDEKIKSTKKVTKKSSAKASTGNSTKAVSKEISTSKSKATKKASTVKETTKKTSSTKEITKEPKVVKETKTAKKSAVKKEPKEASSKVVKASAPSVKKATKKEVSKKISVKDAKVAKKKTTTTKKTSSNKKVASSKSKKTSTTSKTATTRRKKLVATSIEYYDLPNKYNKTMVKVLFQTPKKLFVYWEISDFDRENLIKQNGENFFTSSTPFLIVRNETLNYSFEIEINDYANSWYFNVPDSNCKYSVELIRKFNNKPIQIKSSNELEVPNNHILFEQNRREVFFINVKTNSVTSKNIANLKFINHLGITRPITLNAFYSKFYNEEDLYTAGNPSSY